MGCTFVRACSGKGRKFDKIEAFIKFGKGAVSPTVSARRDVCTAERSHRGARDAC